MKIRNGFVSNSSSTSFALYGAYISDEEVEAAGEKRGLDIDDMCNCEILEALLEDTGLSYATPNGDYLVGVDFEDMRDDETKAQFRERIQNTLQEIFGQPISCSYESGEYYS